MWTPWPRTTPTSATGWAAADLVAPRRILFVSNGIGEDVVGAQIIRRLPSECVVDAFPTLGPGAAYDGVATVVGPRAYLASEGSRVARGSLTRDIATGGIGTIPPALAFLWGVRGDYDRVVVIGDFIGVGACFLTGHRRIVYLDVYKTGYGRPYSWLETMVIRATCRIVFNRSDRLAASLVARGVDARAVGNVMMDAIERPGFDAAGRRRHARAVTLLPGSRAATAENFALQVEALRRLPEALRPDVFLALASGIDPEDLAAATGLAYEPAGEDGPAAGTLSEGWLTVHLARQALGDLVEASDLVLSQAGTATIQSLGMGRPVITCVRPTDRRKRFLEENRLFGDARRIVDAQPQALTAALATLLEDTAERQRLGAIGRERIGGPGAIDAVIAAIGEGRSMRRTG